MAALAERLVDRSLERSIPLSVQIDLTMRCNEQCVHCYRVIEGRPELTTAQIEAVLGELAQAGTFYLTFSGGEVFLRKDLFALIAHAKRLAFDVQLKSNALLVTEATAARLRERGVRQVDVSVYSADALVHDAVTKVPGSLTRTILGITLLRDAGIAVRINCPIMMPNAETYEHVRALAESLGVAAGFDLMITARNDGDRTPLQLRVGRTALRRALQDQRLNPDAGRPAQPFMGRADLDDIPCSAGHTACYISPYGDVMPCVAMPIACGNVLEEPFAAIWYRSARMREVRAVRIRDLRVCSSCAASSWCARCPGQAVVEDGDLHGPSSAACDHALAGAQIAGSGAIPAGLR